MAITSPVALPSPHRIASFTFDLRRFDSVDFARSGHMTAVQVAPPLWALHFETTPLVFPPHPQGSEAYQAKAYQAWLDSRRGAQGAFYAHSPAHVVPQAYTEAQFAALIVAFDASSFADGLCEWENIGADRDAVDLIKMPAAMALTAGDMFSLHWDVGGSPRRSLHRLIAASTANGSGKASVTFEPQIIGTAPSTGVACLYKPSGIFRLDPDRPPQPVYLQNKTVVITYDAIQALYRT